MRAANDPIRHDDGFDCMRLDHRDNLTANSLVKTHITPGGEEPLQDLSFFVFSTENGHPQPWTQNRKWVHKTRWSRRDTRESHGWLAFRDGTETFPPYRLSERW